MRKIVFWAHGDCVGTDTKELVCFPDIDGVPVSNIHLDQYAESFGYDWAGMWEPNCGDEDDDYEDSSQYYEACGWGWDEYNPSEHNGEIDSDAEGYEETHH